MSIKKSYCIDIHKMCDIKGPIHVYFLDTNNIFRACNKLKLDFCEDILGKRDIIGSTPSELLCEDAENSDTTVMCYLDNQIILKTGQPRQFFHRWMIKGQYKLDLLTFKMPIYDENKKPLGILALSHIINKFSVEKAYHLGFSKRETECLFFLLEGYTAKEIAKAIALSPRTVEGYIVNMKDKLKCSTLSELLVKSLQEVSQEGLQNLVNDQTGNVNPLSEFVKNKTTFNSIQLDLAE